MSYLNFVSTCLGLKRKDGHDWKTGVKSNYLAKVTRGLQHCNLFACGNLSAKRCEGLWSGVK